MEPWGISGPQFVGLYSVAMLVAVIATIVAAAFRPIPSSGSSDTSGSGSSCSSSSSCSSGSSCGDGGSSCGG